MCSARPVALRARHGEHCRERVRRVHPAVLDPDILVRKGGGQPLLARAGAGLPLPAARCPVAV
ncbi:hypothetical protein, partial [Streptomyces clavuligerus]